MGRDAVAVKGRPLRANERGGPSPDRPLDRQARIGL